MEIGRRDLTWGTKAGKLPISTMSLKWLNLNFDKAADGEEEEEGEEQKKSSKKKTLENRQPVAKMLMLE